MKGSSRCIIAVSERKAALMKSGILRVKRESMRCTAQSWKCNDWERKV